MPIINITDNNHFANVYTNSENKFIMVDFTASWCGPCKRISPYFIELSKQFPNAIFCKIDVDDCQDIAEYHRIRAMPTFILFQYINGTLVEQERMEGSDKSGLLKMIDVYFT